MVDHGHALTRRAVVKKHSTTIEMNGNVEIITKVRRLTARLNLQIIIKQTNQDFFSNYIKLALILLISSERFHLSRRFCGCGHCSVTALKFIPHKLVTPNRKINFYLF